MSEYALKKFSFGGCNFQATSPRTQDLGADTKCLNIRISFEDALKLGLAVEECLRDLNRMKRSTKEGKRSALNLAIYLTKGRMVVTKGQIPAKERRISGGGSDSFDPQSVR